MEARVIDEVRKDLLEVGSPHACCTAIELDSLILLLDPPFEIDGDRSLHRAANPHMAHRLERLAALSHDRSLEASLLPSDDERGPQRILLRPPLDEEREERLETIARGIQASQCCAIAFLRALFLRGGYLSEKGKGFHLEIVPPDEETAALCQVAESGWGFGLHGGTRRERPLYWIKSGESVARFLGLLGSITGLLAVEDTMASRSLRNEINRSLNCEVANIKRASRSALDELEDIKYLASKGMIQYLPPSLREVALLRLRYPEATLREIGEKLSPPLTKTGIHHRMRRIREAAQIERKSDS